MDAALRSLLDWYGEMGVDVPKIAPARPASRRRLLKPEIASPTKASTSKPSTRSTDLTQVKSLDDLYSTIRQFDAGVLGDGARQAVICRGNPDAKLMIIGEAPGRDEDREGKPFIGRAGQLLDRMLAAIALSEGDVYITNVVNWRPPKNRNPSPDEIEMCRPLLEKHIELVQPKALLLVGGISMTTLTGLSGIMKNHGQWQNVSVLGQDYPALPLYHPAFLLRRPELKKEAWRDLLLLREKLLSL